MCRAHIARHLAAPREVTPGGKHFHDAIRLFLPDESVWAVRTFLARWRRIENDLDGMVKEVDRLVVIYQEIYTL